MTDTPNGNGIAYEAHIYDNKGGSTLQDKINLWNTYVTVAVQNGLCVIIGEFGPTTDGGQDNSGCTPFESTLISWINGSNPANYVYSALGWCWHNQATPRLIQNWSFAETTCHGTQVKNWLASVVQPICGTPTNTSTPTRTFTNTFTITPGGPTFTFTPTPTNTPAYDLIYDGDTAGYRLSDGTVYNGGSGTMTETTGGKTGNGMRLYYNNPNWWQEHRWDLNNNKNIGSNTYIVFDVKADTGTVSSLIRINWTNNYPNIVNYLVEGGNIDTTWKTARVPLSVLLETGQTAIDFINFINNTTTNYTVMVDNIRLERNQPTATNTSTTTRTNTATNTGTNTPSPTNTATNTGTSTRTNTITNTVTNTLTNTATNIPSHTVTVTGTQPATWTNTNTPTNTSSHTPSFTSTTTITYTVTSAFTATISFTQTSTYTFTSTFTNTTTSTQVLTSTGTNTITSTLTFTETNTSSNTATFTHTQPVTFTPTLTPVLPFIPTATENLEIINNSIIIYPQPYSGKGEAFIKFRITKNVKEAKIRIFTTGFRLVKEFKREKQFIAGENEIRITEIIKSLANGIYYFTIELNDDKGQIKSKINEIIIIR